MATERHATIHEIAQAIRDRVADANLFAEIAYSQSTRYAELAEAAVHELQLPCAVIILGPMEYEGGLQPPGQRTRDVNPALLVVCRYSADFDRGVDERGGLWHIVNQLDHLWMPDDARGENIGRPVTIDSNYYVPGGWSPVNTAEGYAGGVYNLVVTDVVASREDPI